MKIHFSNLLGTAWVSVSSKIFQKPLTLECLCFPIFFPYYGNSLFPYFGNCMDLCFTLNSWETHYFGMFVLFPYFSRITGIHFSHILGIVWISASSELFKKPINVCVFPYFSRIMEIHFSHVLQTAWISASSEEFQKHSTSKCLCFLIFFSLLWDFTFPIFWELYGFALHPKYLRNPLLWNVCIFSHTFPVLWKFTFPTFW